MLLQLHQPIHPMKTSLCFLLAARRCEMADLQQLVETSQLVRNTAALIHHLQRERGLSNLFTGSKGQQFAQDRDHQLAATDEAVLTLRVCFDGLNTDPMRHGARLFSRIAYALHGLEVLAQIRSAVSGLRLSTRELSCEYARLIARLISVVFEAADMATDPALSRLLVALFNLMQGKEFAGQERAAGSAMWAEGQASREAQQQLLHLIDSQDKCLKLFESFATPDLLQLWQKCQSPQVDAERERLRRMLCNAGPAEAIDTTKSGDWFACCSQRMDEMRLVEDQMSKMLVELAQARLGAIAEGVQTIEQMKRHVEAAGASNTALASADLFPADTTNNPSLGPALEKSVLDMVQEQASRLQAMAAELDLVRASLSERKLIERAKGLLMAHQQLTEEAAHKTLRDLAMRQNKRMVEVAEAVLSMAALLGQKA
jgi:hypothetical protein